MDIGIQKEKRICRLLIEANSLNAKLWSIHSHVEHKGAQVDESARSEEQEEAVRARRDRSGVGLVVVAGGRCG